MPEVEQEPRRPLDAVRHTVPPNTDGWLTRERLVVILLAVLTAISLYICYLIAVPFLPALAWALALAVLADPLHNWFCRRMGRKEWAAGLAVAAVAVVIVAPTLLIAQQLVSQAGEAAQRATNEQWLEKLDDRLEGTPRISAAYVWVKQRFSPGVHVQQIAERVGASIPNVVMGSVFAIAELLIALFALFYFFRDKGHILRGLRSAIPLSSVEAEEVFVRVKDTIYATIYGHLLVAMIQGALGGIMFWILGLPGPLLWGTVMAFLSIVPVLGAFIVWVPAAIFLAATGHVTKAIILTVWGTVIVGLIDNILYPILVGRKLQLHTLPVFFAIIGGLFVFGISGLVIGPIALAVSYALLEIWRIRTAGNRPAEKQLKAA